MTDWRGWHWCTFIQKWTSMTTVSSVDSRRCQPKQTSTAGCYRRSRRHHIASNSTSITNETPPIVWPARTPLRRCSPDPLVGGGYTPIPQPFDASPTQLIPPHQQFMDPPLRTGVRCSQHMQMTSESIRHRLGHQTYQSEQSWCTCAGGNEAWAAIANNTSRDMTERHWNWHSSTSVLYSNMPMMSAAFMSTYVM